MDILHTEITDDEIQRVARRRIWIKHQKYSHL